MLHKSQVELMPVVFVGSLMPKLYPHTPSSMPRQARGLPLTKPTMK